MNSQMVQFIPYSEAPHETKEVNLRDTINKYLYHWPLFLTIISLGLIIAHIYIQFADRVYKVNARLLFKNEQTDDGRRESALEELDIVPGIKVVENEMEILKSRILMTNVVNDLQLWASYTKIGALDDNELYSKKPFQIALSNPNKIINESIIIQIKDDKQFILKQGDRELDMVYSDGIQTKSGIIAVKPTKYLKGFIGETIKVSLNNPNSTAESILANFTTEIVNNQTTVVEMSLKETVPERGKDIVDRLVAAYNLAAIEDKNRITESTLKFIDERLTAVAIELNSVEKAVELFKSSKGLTDISSQSDFFIENLTENDRKLNEVNIEIQVLDGIIKYVNAPESSRPPATVGISDPAVATLVNQLITLEFQRDRLLASTPESNPIFDPINRQLHTTRESIKDIIHGIRSSLLLTRQQLQTYDTRFVSSIKNLPGQEREYLVMHRQQGIKEELYTYLLKKREEAALSYASTLSNSRVVEKAFYGGPISPRVPLIYAMAIILGLMLPAGFIYGRDLLNNRILSSKEVVTATSVPLLGELVFQEGSKVLVMNERNCRVIAEQFRALRTNLQFVQGSKNDSRVIMLTSSMSGEGKSFIACNLGVALAASGRRTIVLEMDLRKPTISKYFNQNADPGLGSFLKGDELMEQIVQPVIGHPNLFVIQAGEILSNPSEFFEEPRIKELLGWLRSNFDEVLIDTPPVQLVTDGIIVSQYCDIHLYVVRQGFTYKSHLEYIKQLYEGKKLSNLHLVFNGIDMNGRYSYKTDVDYNYYTDDNLNLKKLSVGTTIKHLVKRF